MADLAGSNGSSLDRTPGPATVLNSWKDIAQYLGRSVRTVQRWESALQMPVHRPRGSKRSAVIGIPAEIDAWLMRTPVRELEANSRSSSRTRPSSTRRNPEKWAELLAQTGQLCNAVVESCERLYAAVSMISDTIKKNQLARENAMPAVMVQSAGYPVQLSVGDSQSSAREN